MTSNTPGDLAESKCRTSRYCQILTLLSLGESVFHNTSCSIKNFDSLCKILLIILKYHDQYKLLRVSGLSAHIYSHDNYFVNTGFHLAEEVPSAHKFCSEEYKPVDSKSFISALRKEVSQQIRHINAVKIDVCNCILHNLFFS